MPRAKHGHYDRERKLPDNTGQPVGSGWMIEFHGLIRECLGEEAGQALIDASREKGRGMTWLLAQLKALGQQALVEAWVERRRADDAAARIREREWIIAQCQAQLETVTDPGRRRFLESRIALAQKYLDERRQTPQEPPKKADRR